MDNSTLLLTVDIGANLADKGAFVSALTVFLPSVNSLFLNFVDRYVVADLLNSQYESSLCKSEQFNPTRELISLLNWRLSEEALKQTKQTDTNK